ncbi:MULTISPECIES: flagellar hook-basal body complex protein FliE [unclassified Massilia]|uniref:flagellar hook-basal body complex protein FliE n=1 Tax=unclassified Massilia TaxID=2609279 RepID=UPI001B82FCF0|nr:MULTISPECIES: flagellar hook-basal body complex protein FliE [unclassified Massilia]MBQ5942889.1 flagellar hook-basal body complex protein FliE [Massilia sp. AB1]MBQ5963301.1 flagellar hook-basal body complex protein FliE [Massilia sp. ZL223]
MSIGGIGGIDSSRIQAMMEQLKAAATKPASVVPTAPAGLGGIGGDKPVAKLDFADALQSTLQEVSNKSRQAEEIGKRFAMGDDTVSLSDTMIAMQKSSIAFQATVQVRNKLVSAYHDIMNMQV